jgi:hypothetical protein
MAPKNTPESLEWLGTIAQAEAARYGTEPPKTLDDAQRVLAALASTTAHADEPLAERIVAAGRAAWKAFYRAPVPDINTRQRERAKSLLAVASLLVRDHGVDVHAQARAMVENERLAAPSRGDMLRDVAVDRWVVAIERAVEGFRSSGRPRQGDKRLCEAEAVERLLLGEESGGNERRAKTARDATKRAAKNRR